MKEIYLNSNIYKVFKNDICSNMLNHGYLLISNDKLKINQFGEFLCCTILANDDFDNNTSLKIVHGNHPDVKVYPQNNKGILTEDVNKITDDSFVLPMEGDKKIYILKNFEQATIQAQNKLLKTLEEPSKSVVFILTTTNENSVLPTIRSRCKKIVEGVTSDELLIDYIKRNYKNIDDESINKLVKISQGNLSVASEYITNKSYLDMVNLADEVFLKLKSSANVLELSSKMQKFKGNLEEFLNILLNTFKNVVKQKINNSDTNLGLFAKGVTDVIMNAIRKVKSNCSAASVCDGVLMGILEVKFKCQK